MGTLTDNSICKRTLVGCLVGISTCAFLMAVAGITSSWSETAVILHERDPIWEPKSDSVWAPFACNLKGKAKGHCLYFAYTDKKMRGPAGMFLARGECKYQRRFGNVCVR